MIVTVVGARPQFVKAAVVSRALSDAGVVERIVHTGQHYDEKMSGVFWRELGLPGVFRNLEVGSGGHGAQTGRIMERLESHLLESSHRPRGMLLYGDTNSTLAAALVAAKLAIPIFHVEAGLRSYNRSMPEEVNRVVTDTLSTLLYCPGDNARDQLAREGITSGVEIVGDVMLDAFMTFREIARRFPEPANAWNAAGSRRRALLTLHRQGNTDSPARIDMLLARLRDMPVEVLWPVHPRLAGHIGKIDLPANVKATEPLSYFEMLRTLERAEVVITDSGGLQKEAYWSRLPCVTLRSETEWVETLEGGWNTLIGDDLSSLESAVLSTPRSAWAEMYGDGRAAVRIAGSIAAFCA
ncbi:MAG: non-hydrolyzing UDP-N-acetylglucosamine 2-epimerase [Gemmatimonadaceae bacterium]